MTKKKTAQTAKKKKKAPRKSGPKRGRTTASQWQKGLLGVAALVLLVVAVAFLADRLVDFERPSSKTKPPAPAAPAPTPEPRQRPGKTEPAPSKTTDSLPVFEVYPKQDLPAPQPPPSHKPLPPDQRPKVAIIIDDLGYDRGLAEKFLSLDANLTASILPGSPFHQAIIEFSRRKGVETMLHLPMEPNEYPAVDPGPGALLTSMPPDRLIAQLEKELDAMPAAKGVNNHMGSHMTRESDQMQQIFSVLKKRDLYFIDSRTSAETVGRPTARLLQIPFAERDIFIDHVITPEFIQGQVKKLIRRANRQGQAVGIAHPHEITYEVLAQELPELKKHVQLVPASQVVHAW